MSYNIGIYVKVEGAPVFAQIAEPEWSSPSYNFGKLFRACMDWDYCQGNYYPCDFALECVNRGIKNLVNRPSAFDQCTPENRFRRDDAIQILLSIRQCIIEQAEEIPVKCLFMRW